MLLSYFNRKRKTARGNVSANITGIGNTIAERSINHRVYFLTWGDDPDELHVNFNVFIDTVGARMITFLQDDSGASRSDVGCDTQEPTANYLMAHTLAYALQQSRGMHMLATMHQGTVGSGSVYGTNPPKSNCHAIVKG
jgi:hypothetical protein